MAVNRTEERIELTAIDKTSAVVNQVRTSFGELRTGLDATKNALLAIGSVVGAGAMLQFAQDTLKATAALGNMATATGATVENLSRLQGAAKIGGHDFEGLTGAIGNLIKGLKVSNEEEKVAAHALEYLGVKAKDANGRFRDTVEILVDVAKALSRYEDGGNKVALVQDILGKSAAAYLPLLKDIGENGLGAAKVTKEQAEEADRLEKNINRLTSALMESKRRMVLYFVPALIEVTDKLVKASQQGRLASQSLLEVFKAGGGAALTLGSPLGGWLGKQAAGFVEGERDRYRGGPDLWAIAKRQMGGDANPWGTSVADWMEPGTNVLNYQTPNLKKPPSSAAAVKDDYTSMARALEERIALMQAELAASEKLTDAQKEAIKIRADVEKGYKTLTPLQLASVEAWLKEVDALDKSLQYKQNLVESEKRLADEARSRLQQQIQSVEQMDAENKRLAEQNAEIGLTTEQLGLLRVARIEERIATEEASLAVLRRTATGAAEIAVLEDQIAALRQLADLTREGARRNAAVEQAKAAEDQWRRTSETIERGLTDALMRGFESGKGFGRNMLDAIINMFKTAVLEPMIRPIIQSAAGSLTNMLMPGMARSMGGSGMPGMPGTDLSSLFGGGNLLYGGAMSSATSAAAVGGVATGAFDVAGMGALAGADLAGTGAGMMAGIGGALPWVGGALAVGSMLGLFDDGGGPKPSDIALIPNGAGGLHFSQNNVTDTGWGEAYSAQFAQRYAKLTPEGRAMMNAGSWQAEGPATAQSMVQQYIEPMLRAAEEAAEKNAKAAEDQAKAAEQQLEAARSQERQVSDRISAAAAGMSGALGIDTLSAYRDSLSTSGYLAPSDRLGGARAIFDRTYRSALGGDLDAVNAFPDAAQSLLGIARDTYASGSEFQSIFVETNRALNDVLGRQQNVQQELLRDVTASILEAQANNNVTYIRAFNEMKEELVQIRAELRRRAA